MGCGISLNKQQLIFIIKRTLVQEFREIKDNKKLYTDDGILIPRNLKEEDEYYKKLKILKIELDKLK